MSAKRRVYEVARDLGMDNKSLLGVLETLGVADVKNHMSVLSDGDEDRVKKHLGKGSEAADEGGSASSRPRVVKRRVVRRRRTDDGVTEEAAVEARPNSAEDGGEGDDFDDASARSAQSAPTAEGRSPQRAFSGEPSADGSVRHVSGAQSVGDAAQRTLGDAPRSAESSAVTHSVTHHGSAGASGASVGSQPEVKSASDDRAMSQSRTGSSHDAEPEPKVAAERAAAPAGATVSGHAAPTGAQDPAVGSSASGSPVVTERSASAPSVKSATIEAAATEEERPAAGATATKSAVASAGTTGSTTEKNPNELTSQPSPSTKSVEPARDAAAPAPARVVGFTPPTMQPRVPATAASPGVRREGGSGLPAAPGAAAGAAAGAVQRPTSPPKRGVEVWEGRPGVPMTHHRPGPRRVQYDAKAPAPAGSSPGGPGGMRRGPGGRVMRGGGRPRGIGSFSKGRGGAPVTKERGAHKKVVRIEETVNLQTLAANMGVKATDLLRKLMQLGLTGININSTLDADTAKIVAAEFGWDVEDVAVSEEEQLQKAQGVDVETDEDEDLEPRPPVVTIMGHVDHGKTSLLDALRSTNVVSGEAGGITQHIGAYSVETERGKITFLDTPGHAAFTQMRARGAQATDIVVLVVAADDGVMPQTKEAISHAKQARVPIVVAVNKCDKPEAQPERVRRELSEQGLVPEEWGGETLFCEVSAHTRQGLPELLDKLLLQSEMLELRANPNKPGSGIVIEAQLDRGRGPLATVLVQEGTLRAGDVVLAGAGFGKVRAMHDWAGRVVKTAGPSEPVALIGLSEVPRAGDHVYVVRDVKTAQGIADTRKVRERKSLAPSAGNKPRSLEEIAKLMAESEQMELKVIVKADVAGSAEAVSESLLQLSTEKVRVSIVLQAAGAITENDVNLAVAAGAIIVGFNSKPAGKAALVAQREGIQIRQYSIIYNVIDDVKLAMEGLLAPKLVEKDIGMAEIRQTFRISKAGMVCGCMVTSGVVRRGANARLLRDGELIWEGKIVGLKRFKDDAREVKDGFECGISLENSAQPNVGDVISVFDTEEVKQSL